MVSYEDNEGSVTLHFDRGQPQVHAQLLIGADGYFSRIRKQCLNDGPPLFSVFPPHFVVTTWHSKLIAVKSINMASSDSCSGRTAMRD